MILAVPLLLLTASVTLEAGAVDWIHRPRNRLFINEGETARINWKFVTAGAIVVVYNKKASSLSTKETRIATKKEGLPATIAKGYQDKIFVEKSGALRIINAGISDEGFYGIRITYETGYLTDEVEIKIQKAPIITNFQHYPKTDVYYTGMTIRLVCVAEGRPVPDIFWYKDDLEDPLEKSTGSVVHTIKSSSKKDSGKYSCLASNQAGKANRTIEFIMYRRPHDVDFVHNTALDGTIFEGQSVTFSCSAKGSPAISYYNLRQNGREFVNMTNGIFKIDEVRLEHSGTYTCVPINKAGLGENKTTILRVQTRPSYWRNKLKTTPKSRPSKKQTVGTFETMKTTPERIDVKITVHTKAGNLVGAGSIINSNMPVLALFSFVFIQIIEFARD